MRTTSSPGQGPPARAALARRTLLQRFRTTAPPSFFPATNATRPCGPRRSSTGMLRAVTSGLLALVPCLNSVSISRVDLMVRMSSASRLTRGARRLSRKNRAALAPARCEDSATSLGRHAHAEAVRLGPPAIVRLKGPLHIAHSILEGRSWWARTVRAQSRMIIPAAFPQCQSNRPGGYVCHCSLHTYVRIRMLRFGPSGPLRQIRGETVDTVENAGFTGAEPVDNPGRPIVRPPALCSV